MASEDLRSRLCLFCQWVNLEDMKSSDGYVHQPTCDDLLSSSEVCDLCQLIVNLVRRHIHQERRATGPRDISDAKALGPVRLFAASRELDLDVHVFQRRERSPVHEKLLSQRVAVTLGNDAQPMYGPAYPTLLMFTNPGSFAEAMGVVGLS
ncbi:hypothetical protein EDB81DRAFT_624341, partial [Dactylonectria macrodidyma]